MSAVVGTRRLRKEDPPLLTGEVEVRRRPRRARHAALRARAQPATRTPASARSTRRAAAAMPGVVAVFTGADLVDDWASPMPCAWPVTDDMKNPASPAGRGRARSATWATRSRSSSLRTRTRRATRSTRSIVDYEPARPGHRSRGRARRSCRHPRRSRDELVVHVGADTRSRRGRRRVRRRGAHGTRAVRAAAPDPGRHGSRAACAWCPQPFAEEYTIYSSTQIPHILKIMLGHHAAACPSTSCG